MRSAFSPHFRTIDFPPYRLDLRAGQLYRDGVPVRLRPKSFAVLEHLVERPGELLTKQALLDAVWGHVAVTEDVVRLSVRDLRMALGDEPAAPRFIETVARRGYRFIANLGAAGRSTRRDTAEHLIDAASSAIVVGRARERAEIAEWLRRAASGSRQIGFVSGEAGIGKTTLVDAALRHIRHTVSPAPHIGRGQCIEHYGSSEPYLPVLEALAGLCRGPDGPAVVALLREHAPGWLLDALGIGASRIGDRGDDAASARDHTLHKLAASLEALAADRTLVLLFEDVHGTDHSTLDLISLLAQRRTPARLLILCTLRPVDAIVRRHPIAAVKRELLRKGQCRELLLGGLSPSDVARYLTARFQSVELPKGLLPLLVDRSDGNPFFVVALVDHLVEQGHVVRRGGCWELGAELATLRAAIPAGLRAVIEPRLERLSARERRLLETASVAGLVFAAQLVACTAAPDDELADVETVEAICDRLLRRQDLLQNAPDDRWADGAIGTRYAFRHALYQQVIYQGLSSSRRRRLHQTIGAVLERAHGERWTEVAAELAVHFELAGDSGGAARAHAAAAAHARSRSAYQDARLHYEAALALLHAQPETDDRLRQELPLLDALGATLCALRGFGSDGAVRAYARLRELAERLDAPPMRARAMDGLIRAHTVRGELNTARALGDVRLALAGASGEVVTVARTRLTLCMTMFHLGEAVAAHQHAAAVRALVDQGTPSMPTALCISSSALLAMTCGYLGRIAEARSISADARARAIATKVPYLRAYANHIGAQVHALLRDEAAARALAEETDPIAAEYGLSPFRLAATVVRIWCDVRAGGDAAGLAALREAVVAYAASGHRTTFFSTLLAEAQLAHGDVDAAREEVNGALAYAARTGQKVYEHELHRLKGECALIDAPPHRRHAEAAAHFERALEVAAERGAWLFELRAATSLAAVRPAARARLADRVARFAASDDCADLRAARAALAVRPARIRSRAARARTTTPDASAEAE